MMNKDNDHIDEIFKDAFDGMEAAPNENLWDNIADDISEEKVDDLFKEAFSGGMAQPSDKVWDGVKQHLPLDLRLKRSLNSLSIIAGIVVVGMLVIISLTPDKNDGIIPIQEEASEYNIEIAIEEIREAAVITAKKEEVVKEETLAIDNSIKDKIQSVELQEEEEEFIFSVDADKMKEILQPIAPLPLEFAVASVNEENEYPVTIEKTEQEIEIIVPEKAKEEIEVVNKDDKLILEGIEE